jgi:16S rRNA C967 or C1407 C5-methylase (RsmB/RsmF family)
MRNDRMIAYYTYQNVFGHGSQVAKEEDRKAFLSAACSPLNASFRITKLATPEFKEQFTSRMQEILGSDGQITIEYETPTGKAVRKLKPPQPIPFIENGWKLDVDRSTIRKNKGLKEFFQFLMVSTDAGLITRQETVSMVPPVALSLLPSHVVLDTCAAPGSKTCQILEDVSEGDGWVMANDVNVSRAHMLVHQCKRINR